MPFSYYNRLSKADKAVYLASARVGAIRLADPTSLRPTVDALRAALARAEQPAVEEEAGRLARAITRMLGVPPVEVTVLAVRPRYATSELHGLYTFGDGERPHLRVWMRTAAHRRVVAFRTFLRTFLHEVCHHLDYHLLELSESFHTEGFFKRESSLFHQLVPREPAPPPPESEAP